MANKSDGDDLIGFRDFLDTDGTAKQSTGKRTDQVAGSGFELYTFLERESKRLDKLIHFLEEKTYMLKHYPQDSAIIIKQEDDHSKLIKDITRKLKRPDAPVNKSISDILQHHFNS